MRNDLRPTLPHAPAPPSATGGPLARAFPWVAASSLVLGACSAPSEAPVREGLNDSFLDESLDVDEYVGRFEVESREVYRLRDAIVEAVEIAPGSAVADVGAGTGLFLEAFASAAGPGGRVYAVDISPGFVEHLQDRVRAEGLDQVEVVLCTEKDARLPEDSVDVVFVCDTYHHFTYPQTTLASLRRALRPGGRLVVVDFERIEGVSREWVLGHVRAGKEVFRAEIEEAGFEYLDEVDVGLEENYLIRFGR